MDLQELRDQVTQHMAALDDGGFAAGDGEDYDPEVLALLLDVVEAAQKRREACERRRKAAEAHDLDAEDDAMYAVMMADDLSNLALSRLDGVGTQFDGRD